MDNNIQVEQNSKLNKKKKSKLSNSDNTDAGPSDNSIERSDTTVIKPKKSFWKNIFRFKSRKQEIPESVVTDIRRGAMKVPHLDTIFEERDDAAISESGSKDTEKTDTSAKAWIPLKDCESAKVESATEEYIEDDSLSSDEEEVPREKIILPEGNADKILKEIQAQMKKSKVRKQNEAQKQEAEQASAKEEYSFEYSGSSGQSLDDEEKAKEEITEEIEENVVDVQESNEVLSTHPSNEVVDKLSEKKVTFLPEPYDELPVIPEDTELLQQVKKILSEDTQVRPEGSAGPGPGIGIGRKLDTKTPEGSLATLESVQLKEQTSALKSQSSFSPSAPKEQSLSQIFKEEDIQERKVEESSSANKIMRTAPFFNNNNTITHVTSPSTSITNGEDAEDEDWRYMFEDNDEEDRQLEEDAEHRMYVEMAKMEGVQSSDSMNEIEVWSEDLNDVETNEGYVAHSNIARLPTYEQVAASNQSRSDHHLKAISAYEYQKARVSLTFQEYCNGVKLPPEDTRYFQEMPNDLPDKTYSTLNDQKGIFSKTFMYNFHAETRGANNFQARLSFPPKEGREELPFDTKKVEEKGDIRLDKFFKMVFDQTNQDYTVVYDPIPSELPDNVFEPQTQSQGDERCKVTRKRKIISLLQDKRLYDEYLKEFEATEPISAEATNRDSKINLLLLDGSGTQITSYGRSISNTSIDGRQRFGRHDLSSAGSDGAGPSRWHRPTKSLDDLRKLHKYYVPYNSPAGLSSRNSRAPDLIGTIDEASGSTLVSASSIEEPGIATVLENTRKKLMSFLSNHSQRSSAEQLNSLYPNNYLERFNVASNGNTEEEEEEEDEIDQISLDSIMSGFDHYDASQNQVEQLTSVCSTEAYHKEKVDTYDTVELDVRNLINDLLDKVDELKEDCIAAGVDRSSNGSLFVDITAKLSGAVAQNILGDILDQTFKMIEANDANGASAERLKAGQSQSALADKLKRAESNANDRNTKDQDAEGGGETNEDMSEPANIEVPVEESAKTREGSKFAESTSFSFDSEFGDLKDQQTTISIVTNSDKPPFLKNHCTLKEGLQKTAGFLTSIYSELCEYNPVSYLMHQSITVKLESDPVEVQEPEPINEQQQANEEAPDASDGVKTSPPEIEQPEQDDLLEEAAGYSEYYPKMSTNVQDSQQYEHVIAIQTNERFVVNQVNLEDAQPQQSSWTPKCVKVTKDFHYLNQDKNAMKPTEKFRFVSAKEDSEIEQKLIYAFDGTVPESQLNVSFLEHEHNTEKEHILQDANIEMTNIAPSTRERRGGVSEERPRFDSESEQSYRFPTEHSNGHAHVKFSIPEVPDDISAYRSCETAFSSDVDELFGFRYMDPTVNAFSFSIISPDSLESSGSSQPELVGVQKNAAQTDAGPGEMSESNSFFTHTLNTAQSFVKRLENELNTMKLELPPVVPPEVPAGEQAQAQAQAPGPSSITILMPKQFSAGSGHSEEASGEVVLTALHQDLVKLSGSSSADNRYDFSIDEDILAMATHLPDHLQLERKIPELDLQIVDKGVNEKIEEDLRSFEDSIHKIMDLNRMTIDMMNSAEIPCSEDSVSILSAGGLVHTSSVEKAGADHGNCDQTTIHKLDAPIVDSFQPPLIPTKSLTIASTATSDSVESLNVKESFQQVVAMKMHKKKGPISKISQEEIDAILKKYPVHKDLSEDDFIAQAKQIREEIAAKLKKLREDSQERQKLMHTNWAMKEENKISEDKSKGEVVEFERIKLQREGLPVDLKKSRARNDLSKSSILQVQILDKEHAESEGLLKRSPAEKNLVEATVRSEGCVHQSRKDEIADNLKKCEKLLQNVLTPPTAKIQQQNSCFCVGTKMDDICSGMGQLCVSADNDNAPNKHFNFGLRKSQIFKGELDKKVKVSFGECPSTSSAASEPSTSFCRKSCEDRTKMRRPIEKAIEDVLTSSGQHAVSSLPAIPLTTTKPQPNLLQHDPDQEPDEL